MPALHEETFRYADGSAWPSLNWTMYLNSGTGDIQNMKGRMIVTTIGGYYEVDAATYYLRSNFEILATVELSTIFESYIGVQYRQDGSGNYFRAMFNPFSSLGFMERYDGYVPTSLDTGSFTAVAGDLVHIRVLVDGSSHKLKLWRNRDREPGEWTCEATDATHSTNTVNTMVCMNGFAGNAVTVWWHNIQYGLPGGLNPWVRPRRLRSGRSM